MVQRFLKYLKVKGISYKVINGYKEIVDEIQSDSDYDILFKTSDFKDINDIIFDFCDKHNFKLVQLYHQEIYAKNFFVYDIENNALLNLDLYGELKSNHIKLFDEDELFNHLTDYKGISILKPHQEFIHYLIKNIIKGSLSKSKFNHLKTLYDQEPRKCKTYIEQYFRESHQELTNAFATDTYSVFEKLIPLFQNDFNSLQRNVPSRKIKEGFRILNRIIKPTGFVICFLGPDGSGKSTIIEELIKQRLPFRRHDYFHLKPIRQKQGDITTVTVNPHEYLPYSTIKSYVKLLYFVFQYNLGWFKNIFLLKRKSSLVIFDRYYDDLFVDRKRYRYGGSKFVLKCIGYLIPKPELYFVLTADAKTIYNRKSEISLLELQRQIIEYQKLGLRENFHNINVDRLPHEIVNEVVFLIMNKLNERY